MDSKVLFDQTINTASKALDVRSRRHELIVSNLANADTPGYKAFDMLVEEAMAEQNKTSGTIQMVCTHDNHLASTPNNHAGVEAYTYQVEAQDNLRGDGNTVDMDREMSQLSANQLLYKVSAQIVSKKFQGLKNVIQGGKK